MAMVRQILDGMSRELGGGKRENLPALSGVHELQAERLAEERADDLGLPGIDDRVNAVDHLGVRLSPTISISSIGAGGAGEWRRMVTRRARARRCWRLI